MTGGFHPRDDDLLARAEGRLSGEPLRRLEADLQSSAELRRRMETIRRAEESVRRLFPAPPPFDPASRAAPAERARRPWALRLASRQGLLAAAAGLMLLVAAWRLHAYFNPPPAPAYAITPVSLYDRLVARGFRPDWACKDDAEFIATVRDSVGRELVARSGGSVEIVGWAYAGGLRGVGLTECGRLLLARVEGTPVLVFLDRDTPRSRLRFEPPPGRELRLFTRRVDGVVLHELTPLPAPAAIDRFERPG